MKEIIKPYDLEQKTSLGANAVLLFLFLQDIANAERKVIISDYDLSKILRLARQTIIYAKNTLKENGLIEFHSERAKPTTYYLVEKNQKTNVKIEKVEANGEEIPTLEEFMKYAKSIELYQPNLDFSIKSKYETWKDNGWKNGYDVPIKNWKQSLKNIFPFLANSENTSFRLPTIINIH
ncbi:MAG: hypothetical protein Q4A09_02750 [Capnocytophaga felis]|nr:hypothetical protein [Capnocytophaga felis]